MMMLPCTHVDYTALGRRIFFDLECDPNFVPDMAMHDYVGLNSKVYEPEVVNLLIRALRPGDFAIDGGANIGMLTIAMSRLVGDEGRVVAAEATPRTFDKLCSNIDLNGIRNVTLVPCALWEDDGDVELYQSMDAATNSLRPTEATLSSIVCSGITLQALCGGSRPRLIKLDIEGSEARVLMAARDLLRRGVDFICCEVNRNVMPRFGVTEDVLFDYMASLGYSTFVFSDGLPVILPRNKRIVTDVDCFNVIFSTADKMDEIWQ